jgi:hypothetical protein
VIVIVDVGEDAGAPRAARAPHGRESASRLRLLFQQPFRHRRAPATAPAVEPPRATVATTSIIAPMLGFRNRFDAAVDLREKSRRIAVRR